MEKKEQYRILKYEYFNQYSVVTTEYYYIQEWKKFLWWSYWKDIKHIECGMDDCHKTTVTFKTLEEAEVFVTTKLCTGLPKDEDVDTVVKTFDCGE